MPSKVYLGPNLNFWCDKCNIPILDIHICPFCESKLKKLQITPPFEMVPAFEKDLNLIRRVIDSQFGKDVGIKLLPDQKIVLLNKAPYHDRMDEIILDGFVLGNIRFNPIKMEWEFIPKIEGARRLASLTSRNWIEIDDDAIKYISKGANVLAPGITDYDKEFAEGAHLIILTSKKQAIATGPAKFPASEIKNYKKGMIVKTKEHSFPQDPQIRPAGQTWHDMLKANESILLNREKKAIAFIQKTVEKFKDYPITVSFSGGKDSLCLLILVKEALGPIDVFFIDTGIEFEETITFTEKIIKNFELTEKFTYKKSRESFWDNLEQFGPPARDYRWCCKVIKLASITELLNDRYPNTDVVTFVGARQYESAARHQDKKIWTNSFLPQQIAVSPIQKWASLHIWMYLLLKQVPINPLYFQGYKRIGCIYCPASKLAELELLKEIHPELYLRWTNFLKKWAKNHQLSTEWAERGFWRSRKPKEGQINFAKELNISEKDITWKKSDKLKFHLIKGINPCQDGLFSVEGRIQGFLELPIIINHLKILGNLKYSEDLGIISLRTGTYSLNLFSDGTITIRGDKKILEDQLPTVLTLIKRANDCVGCGICISQCPQNALYLKDDKIWVTDDCIACFSCLSNCPVRIYDE